jgi:hypothetical protein
MAFEREDGERSLASEPADLFLGWRKVSGRLYVTDRRVVFESRRFDSWRDSTEIPLDEVVDAYPWDTVWGPIGLVIRTRGRDRHRFLTWERDRLIDLIHVCRAGAVWASTSALPPPRSAVHSRAEEGDAWTRSAGRAWCWYTTG